MATRRQQRAVDRSGPAGLVRGERRIECQDALRGGLVGSLRLLVRQVVREVRADHDQRLVAAPHALEHLRDRLGIGRTDDQRHEREAAAEQRLQEGQLHLDRMLAFMRPVAACDLGQLVEAGQRRFVERDLAQRCLESLHMGCCQTVEGDPVRGAEHHDPADRVRAAASEQRIGVRRHRAAVFVAGVRSDQQLGRRALGVVGNIGADQIVDDLCAQRSGRRGIEQTVDDGFAYRRHGAGSCGRMWTRGSQRSIACHHRHSGNQVHRCGACKRAVSAAQR
jgi:hypothetical protein